MSPPLQPVSGLIPEHHLAAIRAAGGNDGLSAGLRTVVAAGVLALQGDAALLAPIAELQELTARLAAITGRRTPTGALWCPTADSMPAVEALGAVEVIATPDGLLLVADQSAMALDLAAGAITCSYPGGQVEGELDTQQLCGAAAVAAAALVGLAQAGPGRRELPGIEGLAVERLPHGTCRVSYRGIGPEVSFGLAWVWAAELVSLSSRAITRSLFTRHQLEQQLQEVAG